MANFNAYKITNLGIASGGSLNTVGAYSLTLTVTEATNVTLPASGTLATTANITTHAALLTGVHGLAITAGKTLTVQDDVTITGTLGTAAYTATGDYEPTITNNVESDGTVAGQLKIWDETAGLWDNAVLTEGSNITITEGEGAITIASTASGGIDWDNVITSATNAVEGKGYTINVAASAFALTLPAVPSAGDTIGFKSINSTTYAATLGLNGLKFEGATGDITLSDNEGGTLVYIDAAYGWTLVSELSSSADDDTLDQSMALNLPSVLNTTSTTALATIAKFPMLWNLGDAKITEVKAKVLTAVSTGTAPSLNITLDGTDSLSSDLSVNETLATGTIDTANDTIANGQYIEIDFDKGNGDAEDLVVYLKFQLV